MDAYDICTNLEKILADIVAIYGRGRELFRPPTYTSSWREQEKQKPPEPLWKLRENVQFSNLCGV
jgi:hypothetical protein